MGWGILGDAADALDDGLDKAGDIAEAGIDKAGDAIGFVVDLADATLDECMNALKGLVSLGDEAVEQVIHFLGLPWPEADEGKLRAMAGAYDRMATSLDQVAGGAAPAARAIVAGNKGVPINEFATFWNRYDGGTDAWLPGMAGSCRQQADSLRKLADAVEKQKTVLKAEILAVAATILVGAGLLFVPGVNIVSGAAITAATNIARTAAMAAGLAISESILAIIGSIAGSAVIGAVLSVTLDLAVAQPVKIAMGAQDGITLDHIGTTAAYGAGGGAFAGTLSAGANQLSKLALPTRLSTITSKAPAALQSIPGQTLAGAGGAATLDLVTGNGFNITNVLAGGAGGAAGTKTARSANNRKPKPSIGDVLNGGPIPSPDERAAQGIRQGGVERTLDNSLDKATYLYDVAARYGINLRGSGQDIAIIFDPDLPAGQYGVTRPADGGLAIRIGPMGVADDVTAANTIAHELSHARYFLKHGSFKGDVHGDEDSLADGTPYGSGNALQDWIEGNR